MRHINIEDQTPPREWLDKAATLSLQVQAKHDAGDIEGRNQLIEDNAHIWKELVPWLRARSHDKCWYTEATNRASYLHIDHFRPKKEVKDLDGNRMDGYWWLAFKWENYRLSGSAINVPKSTNFPLREGTARASGPHQDENDETPYLLDPLNTTDPGLLSFDEQGKAIPGDPVGDWNRRRAEVSIELLNLNYDDLTRGRQVCWVECDLLVNKVRNLMADLQEHMSVSKQTELDGTIRELRKKVAKDAQFSAVAITCIYSQGVGWLTMSIF